MFHLHWCLKKSFFMFYRDMLTPAKQKLTRANHALYVTKAMKKAIMKRTQMQHQYFKNRSCETFNAYTHQRNFCRRLYKRENKKYFNSLKLNKITDNKVFWKTVKPLLSDTSINTISVIEFHFHGTCGASNKGSRFMSNAISKTFSFRVLGFLHKKNSFTKGYYKKN